MATPRTCRVPDLGDDLAPTLTRAGELFVGLDAVADEGAELPTPATLVARVGRQGRPWAAAGAAAARLRDAIAPTPRARAGPARLYAPGGRHEHRPLRFVQVDPDDLAAIGAAVAALGEDLARNPHGDAASLLDQHAHRGPHQWETAADLVEQLARVHGLLDLAWTDDVALLHARLAGTEGNVVLDDAEEAAYQRTTGRLDAMWPHQRR
jgi:hypothetical protein